jgi:uncharacterized membrane protein YobD (UPF0266 family)
MDNFDITEKISWQIPEYEKHERDKRWYIIAGSIAAFFALISVITPNWFFDKPNVLFLGIIVIGSMVIYLNDKTEPNMLRIVLADEGIVFGHVFYDYDEIKDFSVLYKPAQDLNHLYVEFKNATKLRLSINLMDQDPVLVRKFLLQYLPEDLERINRPTSETLVKMLKL